MRKTVEETLDALLNEEAIVEMYSRASLPGGLRTSPGSSGGAGVPPRDQEEDESCRDLPGR